MGGADHSNLNIQILKALENVSNIHINVVTTTANQYLNEICEYVAGKMNITLHINTDQLAKLMHDADIAIVTPSVIVNEIIYMEVDFIAIKTATNQEEMYQYLAKNNYMVHDKNNINELKSRVKKLFEHEKN